MEYLHKFPEWMVAVFEHWHGWLSGGLLAFVLELGEKLWDWKPPKRAFVVILGIGLLWSVFAAWRDENHNTEVVINEKSDAWSKFGTCDKERFGKAILADQLSAQVTSLQTQLGGQQDTFNRCILALGLRNAPEPLTFDVQAWKFPETYTYVNVGKVQFWVMVVTANKSVSPLKGTLTCDAPFTHIANILTSHGGSLRAPSLGQINDRSVSIEYAYPPLTERTPLLVGAFTKPDEVINRCTFK
jgi:hypothetical protein